MPSSWSPASPSTVEPRPGQHGQPQTPRPGATSASSRPHRRRRSGRRARAAIAGGRPAGEGEAPRRGRPSRGGYGLPGGTVSFAAARFDPPQATVRPAGGAGESNGRHPPLPRSSPHRPAAWGGGRGREARRAPSPPSASPAANERPPSCGRSGGRGLREGGEAVGQRVTRGKRFPRGGGVTWGSKAAPRWGGPFH